MPVTQRDVAALANVSPMVVSHVMHQRSTSVRVSPATAERVKAAARELGYRCNIYARNFRTQKTEVIGVVHGMGFERPRFDSGSRYFGALMDGVVEGAFKHGYAVTLCPKLLGTKPEDAMSDGRFDGLVWYSTSPSAENAAMLRGCQSPLVIIHGTEREYSRYPTVICDNRQGMSLAVEHLYDLGHRSIAFAWDPATTCGETQERQEGFFKHMDRLGMAVGQEAVFAFDNGLVRDVTRIVDAGYTAVICHNDDLAASVIKTSTAIGLKLPEDLSIVGFDSSSFCNELRPRLTSVLQPLSRIGELAIDLLVQVIGGHTDAPQHLVVPCSLDVRDSTMSIINRCHKS